MGTEPRGRPDTCLSVSPQTPTPSPLCAAWKPLPRSRPGVLAPHRRGPSPLATPLEGPSALQGPATARRAPQGQLWELPGPSSSGPGAKGTLSQPPKAGSGRATAGALPGPARGPPVARRTAGATPGLWAMRPEGPRARGRSPRSPWVDGGPWPGPTPSCPQTPLAVTSYGSRWSQAATVAACPRPPACRLVTRSSTSPCRAWAWDLRASQGPRRDACPCGPAQPRPPAWTCPL